MRASSFEGVRRLDSCTDQKDRALRRMWAEMLSASIPSTNIILCSARRVFTGLSWIKSILGFFGGGGGGGAYLFATSRIAVTFACWNFFFLIPTGKCDRFVSLGAKYLCDMRLKILSWIISKEMPLTLHKRLEPLVL